MLRKNLRKQLSKYKPYKIKGKITDITGNIIWATLPKVNLGEQCIIDGKVEGEVVGFKNNKAIILTYGSLEGVKVGGNVEALSRPVIVKVGKELLGCIVDAFGNPINKQVTLKEKIEIKPEPINPLERARIKEPLDLGIRAINGLLTVGKGQRIGIFAGAGVGKSTTLGMIARYTKTDVNVICLVGERGREVREFIEDALGEEGLKKSVVVVATSDNPPLVKVRSLFTACAIADYFSYQGKDVLFLVDSFTRLAMAQREVGLSVGEPPTTKGYTPSVFNLIPQIIERAGAFVNRGSITGIYTVLVEGDDPHTDPIADAAISFLDGHIVLSRQIANMRIYPAIDVLKSISRLTPQIVPPDILELQSVYIKILSIYKEVEDMIKLGIYKKGTSQIVDMVIEVYPLLVNYIKQRPEEYVSLKESWQNLKELVDAIYKVAQKYNLNLKEIA